MIRISLKSKEVVKLLCLLFVIGSSFNTYAVSGGPDAYGYTFKDSYEPNGPAFSWIDISGTGTLSTTSSCDDCVEQLIGAFPGGFDFYGTTYTDITIGDNGVIFFSAVGNPPVNTALPTSHSGDAFLALYHDDLAPNTNPNAKIYYQDFGAYFIVQYTDMYFFGGTYAGSYQVIMYKNGNIIYNYLAAGSERGEFATIGIQGSNSPNHLQYSHNTISISSNFSILFQNPNATSCNSLFFEDFNTGSLPAGWTNTADGTNATAMWNFGADAGNSEGTGPFGGSLDGTSLIYFNDLDTDGDGGEITTLSSPSIDITGFDSVNMTFDYNFRALGAGEFKVEVFDGFTWVSVLNLDVDDCGTWGCGPGFPKAYISLTPYINSAFKFRLNFNDFNTQSGYVALDNLEICGILGTSLTTCEIESVSGLQSSYCIDDAADTILAVPFGGSFTGSGVTDGVLGNKFTSYAASFPPVDIPDSDPFGINVILPVSNLARNVLGTDVILDNVSVDLEHPWVGEINMALISPAGDTVFLMARPGVPATPSGCSGDDVVATFERGKNNSVENVCNGAVPTISGTYTAHAGRDLDEINVNGGPANGNWVLFVSDNAAGVDGRLIDFTLNFVEYTSYPLFTPATAGVGSSVVTYSYTNPQGCFSTDSVNVVVNPLPDAGIAAAGPFCADDAAVNLVPNLAGGSFSGTGITNASLGTFSPSVAGAGTHTIYYNVTDGNGCSNLDSTDIVVNPLPNASITPVGPFCFSDPAVILVKATPGGVFAGTGITDVNGGEFTPSAAGAGVHWITYTVTNGNGCTNSDSIQITVYDLPLADAGTDATYCSGGTANLGGSPTATGVSTPVIASIVWSPATDLNQSTISNPTTSTTITRTYTVLVTDGNGCKASDNVLVTVNPNPVAKARTDTTVCSGQPVSLGGGPTASGGTPTYTYAWSPSTGLNSTTVGNPTSTLNATQAYTILITDSKGCTSTDNVTVTVNPNPIANAGSDQEVCAGGSANIGGAPTAFGGTPGYIYSWAPGSGLNNNVSSNPIATPIVTRTYTVTITDAKGCTANDNVKITVNPLPVAYAGVDKNVCVGTSSAIGGSPSATGGTPTYTYQWSPTFGLSSSTIANPVASPASTIIYTLTVRDAKNCQAVDDMVFIVNPNPTATAGSNQTTCAGDPVVLGGSPTASGGNGSYTYTWSPVSGLNNSTISNPNATINSTTIFNVLVTDGNGCTANSNVTINVNPNPVANAGADVNVCDGKSQPIGGNPAGSGGTPNYSYSWTPATSLSSTIVPNPIVTPSSTITYTLKITDSKGCSGEDAIKVEFRNLPVLSFTPAKDEFCITDDAVDIQNAATPVGGAFTGSGITGNLFNPTTAGLGTHTITYVYSDSFFCENSTTYDFNVNDNPVYTMGDDQTIFIGEEGEVYLNSSDPLSIVWYPAPVADLDSLLGNNQIVAPVVPTVYRAKITTSEGCEVRDSLMIDINYDAALNAPNVFTPGTDGINDTWEIPILDYFPNNKVTLYNRWGQKVKEFDNYSNGSAWDGADVPSGTYFFVIELEGQGIASHQGHVTIVKP